jgi:hypothetical protein
VARALIIGCGCRGRDLGIALARDGWQVRGTARAPMGADLIEDAGIEPALADPDRVGTVLDLVGDVAVVVWLLGSVTGAGADAVNGPRLARVLAEVVDTPVRGFVYEAAGSAPADTLAAGAALVRAAGKRWRIPVAIVEAAPNPHAAWLEAMASAVRGTLDGR